MMHAPFGAAREPRIIANYNAQTRFTKVYFATGRSILAPAYNDRRNAMSIRTLTFAALGVFAACPALAQEAPKIFFEGDVVRGGGPTAKGPTCVLNSQFKRGETVIFRLRALDAKTGKSLDDKGLKSLNVELSNGEKFAMNYHAHPPKDSTDWFWVGGWPIPQNQPTGSLTYKITAVTLSGETITWSPFKVASSQVTVTGD